MLHDGHGSTSVPYYASFYSFQMRSSILSSPRLINRWKLNGTSVRASFLPDHSNISIGRAYLASLFIRAASSPGREVPRFKHRENAARKKEETPFLFASRCEISCLCTFDISRSETSRRCTVVFAYLSPRIMTIGLAALRRVVTPVTQPARIHRGWVHHGSVCSLGIMEA